MDREDWRASPWGCKQSDMTQVTAPTAVYSRGYLAKDRVSGVDESWLYAPRVMNTSLSRELPAISATQGTL